MRAAYRLTVVVGGLMLAQAALGLMFRAQYRDSEWIATTWLGNDWVTLGIVLPLLAANLKLTRRGSHRAPEAFKLVAGLDTVLMVPALAGGGVLLWRRHAWGYVISAIAGIQGSLYLLVLSINSIIFVVRGLAQRPGELPLWGSLAATTSAATLLLLAHAGRRLGV